MVICPKCKAENRPEAAFCVRCGTILFTKPAQPEDAEGSSPSTPAEQPDTVASEESMVIYPGFAKRPEGAIFGDRFQYDSLVSQEEHDIHYLVNEIEMANVPSVRICSNPDCRTIHCPVASETEKFCTQCGQSLGEHSPSFLLQESDVDKFTAIQSIIDVHLVHPNIHPPVAVFKQEVQGDVRYCLVSPYSQSLPPQPEIAEVLNWGTQLSQALEYMHSKGIALGEQLDQSSIGLAEKKVVWRDFTSARVLPVLTDREKINNVRHLALAMYYWMTGSTSYSPDPHLPMVLNDLFQQALVGEGFTSATEFSKQIQQAQHTEPARLKLDYQVGRRTHRGKVRKNNEDSVLCIEMSRMNQDAMQPICLEAIADGMGGHASGELASSLVIDAIAQVGAFELVAMQNPAYEGYANWIKRAMQSANQAVYEARQSAGNDMGSTLVLGLLVGCQAYLGHLGDSRIYLANQESIKQLTTDHSLVQQLVAMGKITQSEARFHPQRNVIYRSLGEKKEVEADYLTRQLFPGDRLLFCSDGLSNVVDDQEIHRVILKAGSSQEACDRLVELANFAGGDDNISVVIVEVLSF
jgi:serine/threonine protein phosphatase PrpC